MADTFTPILSGLRYVPADMDQTWAGTADTGELYSITLPHGTPAQYRYPWKWGRDDLWPGVHVTLYCSAWATSTDAFVKASSPTPYDKTHGHVWQVLKRGIPEIGVQLPVPHASAPVPGGGYYHAPGGAERRWESANFTSPQKAAMLAVAYFKRYRLYIDGILRSLGKFGWADFMCLDGLSAAAECASQVLLHPNRAGELGTSGQYLEDTRVNCGVLQATNAFKPLMFSGAATFFGNLPKAETSTAGATTVVSAASVVYCADVIVTGAPCTIAAAGKTITKAAGSWTVTPPVGATIYLTGVVGANNVTAKTVAAATANVITTTEALDDEVAAVTIRGNTLTKASGTWTVTPKANAVLRVTGASTNPDPLLVRAVEVTTSVIRCSAAYSVLVNETVSSTITTVASEEKAATFSAAPLRYKHAMGSSRHMPRGERSIPPVLAWSDLAAIESAVWGDGLTDTLTLAHAPETFLSLKQAAPDRIRLIMNQTFNPDLAGVYSPYVIGIPDGYRNNAIYIDADAEKDTGVLVDFILANLHTPITQAPHQQRMVEVEVIGRYCAPDAQGRKRLVVRNTGDDTTTGSASSEDLIVGKSRYDVLATVAVGESYTIEGYEGPVWCRAATAFAKGELHEDFV